MLKNGAPRGTRQFCTCSPMSTHFLAGISFTRNHVVVQQVIYEQMLESSARTLQKKHSFTYCSTLRNRPIMYNPIFIGTLSGLIAVGWIPAQSDTLNKIDILAATWHLRFSHGGRMSENFIQEKGESEGVIRQKGDKRGGNTIEGK